MLERTLASTAPPVLRLNSSPGGLFLNRGILNERLIQLINRFARSAIEARQVARRLDTLLPSRFRELRREHRRQRPEAHAERMALTDPRYLQSVDEYLDIQYQARLARVQYETHSMLFKARQSLRR